MLALCEVQEPITRHKRKTWPRSELNRRMCAHTALPYSSLGKLYRGWNESLIHEVRKHYDPVMGQYLNSMEHCRGSRPASPAVLRPVES